MKSSLSDLVGNIAESTSFASYEASLALPSFFFCAPELGVNFLIG